MKQERIRFEELDFIYPQHFLEINSFKIPIYAHIKNIRTKYVDEITIGENYDDFEFKRLRQVNISKLNFIHINIKDKIFNGFTQTFLEYYNLKSTDDLLYYFDEMDIQEFNNHFKNINSFLMTTYRDRLYNMFKLDEKEPDIRYKDKDDKPKELKDYLQYTYGYIIAQSVMEYTAQPFFEENIGRAVNEFSWREIELRLSYLTMKNKCEGLEHKWQMKKLDDKKAEH